MKIKYRFLEWLHNIQPLLKRVKEVLADRTGEGTLEGCEEILNMFSQVLIGNQVFLVERHFTGSRNLKEAIFTAVENEAKREELSEKAV